MCFKLSVRFSRVGLQFECPKAHFIDLFSLIFQVLLDWFFFWKNIACTVKQFHCQGSYRIIIFDEIINHWCVRILPNIIYKMMQQSWQLSKRKFLRMYQKDMKYISKTHIRFNIYVYHSFMQHFTSHKHNKVLTSSLALFQSKLLIQYTKMRRNRCMLASCC